MATVKTTLKIPSGPGALPMLQNFARSSSSTKDSGHATGREEPLDDPFQPFLKLLCGSQYTSRLSHHDPVEVTLRVRIVFIL